MYPIKEHYPCIWMEAGVVNFKLCDRGYDCLNCPFDRALSSPWTDGETPPVQVPDPGADVED